MEGKKNPWMKPQFRSWNLKSYPGFIFFTIRAKLGWTLECEQVVWIQANAWSLHVASPRPSLPDEIWSDIKNGFWDISSTLLTCACLRDIAVLCRSHADCVSETLVLSCWSFKHRLHQCLRQASNWADVGAATATMVRMGLAYPSATCSLKSRDCFFIFKPLQANCCVPPRKHSWSERPHSCSKWESSGWGGCKGERAINTIDKSSKCPGWIVTRGRLCHQQPCLAKWEPLSPGSPSRWKDKKFPKVNWGSVVGLALTDKWCHQK